MESYQLEKKVWTQDDFETMGWHDNRIHGIATRTNEEEPEKNELLFDIDYIFKWVHPLPPDEYLTFWISPCTLIFQNVYDLQIDVSAKGTIFELEIADINLVEKITNENNYESYYSWAIELLTGSITFKSQGFQQIVKAQPKYVYSQWLESKERGGINFNTQPFS